MKKFVLYLVLSLIVLAAGLRYSLEFESAQDVALEQFARVGINQAAQGLPDPDSLRVLVCGSASPIGGSGQAQACVAVLTPQHFYIVDLGAGSMVNVRNARLPMARLQGVLLTHFHSDHIAEIYEANLNSWVQGRPTQLTIYGPSGVRKLTRAINEAYEMDRDYRITHHGQELLPPELGELNYDTINPGVILKDGDLTITAYAAEHSPVSPAVGYRFDYRGRSVVISGDSLVTDETRVIAAGADLLLHDALSEPIVLAGADAAEKAGNDRLAKIMRDVLDYHASTDSLVKLGAEIDIGMVAYYHLVPTPQNLVLDKIFSRGMPENFRLTKDGDWFELPVGSTEIIQ